MQYSGENGFCITGTTSGAGLQMGATGNTTVNGQLTVTGKTVLNPTGATTVLSVGGTNSSATHCNW